MSEINFSMGGQYSINDGDDEEIVINTAEEPAQAEAVKDKKDDPLSPETKAQIQETKELLRDIYENFRMIPNPSESVKSRMSEIQTRLQGLNGEVAILTDDEIDHLVRDDDSFQDGTFKRMMCGLNETIDGESADEQYTSLLDEIGKAVKRNDITTRDAAVLSAQASDQHAHARHRIEVAGIQELEASISKIEDKQVMANKLEELKTAVVTSKFIDFHTKADIVLRLNEIIQSTAKKTAPSEESAQFAKRLEKRKAEQKKIQEQIAQDKIEQLHHQQALQNSANLDKKIKQDVAVATHAKEEGFEAEPKDVKVPEIAKPLEV